MPGNTSLPTVPPLPLNVVGSRGAPFEPYQEEVFLSRLFHSLQTKMGNQFDELTFVVHRRQHGELPGTEINLDKGGKGRVLIIISDECEVFPISQFTDYQTIFRAYGSSNGTLDREGVVTHPFPIGYLNATGLQHPVEFAKRRNSVFFSGYLNSSRVDLYKQFQRIPWLKKTNLQNRYCREAARRIISRFHMRREFDYIFPNSKIRFTEGFGKGLSPEAYAATLADSRIALCPQGFVSPETIRHWEAMSLGCVVISAPLPDSPYYKGSPIIQIEDWSQLRKVVGTLLDDQQSLKRLHEDTKAWWRDQCSEEAVATYMAKVLASE